jgi:serine/threonine protein kinase/predicted ATPase
MVERLIGPYRVFEPLGHGGMGVVYRARHRATERPVALKTVRVPNVAWLDGIRREIHALTRLRHPGVVRLVDHGVHEGRPWYAMDLLEGETLRHFGQRLWSAHRTPSAVDAGAQEITTTEAVSLEPQQASAYVVREARPLPHAADLLPAAAGELTAVLRLARRLCETLSFLHGEGFINCDLKPDNVLILGDFPVIIDFGLAAQHAGAREALQALRTRSGTLPYMSPEQIRGEFVDARSDLYSVGCMLYELIVGHPPFNGVPRTIIAQHLSSQPVRPSSVVRGVPPELEALLFKLLEKDIVERVGYADEVAAALAALSDDAPKLPDLPPAGTYLYRPRFVGRADPLDQLIALRERATAGSGAFVLIGGESGVGKTRLAMELTRVAPDAYMRIVTSEASALSSEGNAAAGVTPLHALRPLLRAIADRCQEGGPDVTERLLDGRRGLLFPYEPLLAQVPSQQELPPAPPVPPELARQQLFATLRDALQRFAEERPLFLLFDDLGWADELSLAFLQSLSAELVQQTPLFVLGAYRSEEPPDAIEALARLPHVLSLSLPRLDDDAVRAIIGDTLALSTLPAGFLEVLARETEGNPFFLAEYLRAAVAEGTLYRDQQNAWRLLALGEEPLAAYPVPALPRSLRALIERRFQKLGRVARELATAAAIVGREMDTDLLREVAALSEGATNSALDELVRRQVLERANPGRCRFVHDKLREVIELQIQAERSCELHARAAAALEPRLPSALDPAPLWAALGHHFAAARLPQAAAKYLKLAADHARATFANVDAISLYRRTLEQLERSSHEPGAGGVALQAESAQALEGLADVLGVTSQRDLARDAYRQALSAEPRGAHARARLQRKLGKSWESEHRHEEALRCYGEARALLGDDPLQMSREARHEWIQSQIDELWVHYWLNRIDGMKATVTSLSPLIADHASPIQRAHFFQTQALLNFRRDRYAVKAETVDFASAALAACRDGAGHADIAAAQMIHGLSLLFFGSYAAAERELEPVLAAAQRAGDQALRARCLSYLALAARMQGRIEATQAYSAECAAAAAASHTREYSAAALANLAWVSLRNGDSANARRAATEALAIWRALPAPFPFLWLALLPLLELHVSDEDTESALACAGSLLAPNQAYLPDALTSAFASAQSSWSGPDRSGARALLARALEQREGTGYW